MNVMFILVKRKITVIFNIQIGIHTYAWMNIMFNFSNEKKIIIIWNIYQCYKRMHAYSLVNVLWNEKLKKQTNENVK